MVATPQRITMLPGPPTLYHSLLAVKDKTKLATLRAGERTLSRFIRT